MHAAALAYIAAHLPRGADSVLEFGARNINGSARTVTCASVYVGVDIADGDGVDIVADAATVDAGHGLFEAVVCAEVFEHTDDKSCAQIVKNAYAHLMDGGTFVATMAGITRKPHSAFDGGPVRYLEFYRNVTAALLEKWLTGAGFEDFSIDTRDDDLRCWAVKA